MEENYVSYLHFGAYTFPVALLLKNNVHRYFHYTDCFMSKVVMNLVNNLYLRFTFGNSIQN